MQRKRTKRHIGLEIAAGILLIGFGLLASAYLMEEPSTRMNINSPQARYERALRKKKPVFVFAHSTNCEACILMIDIVASVYPSFSEQVELIDIVVSEPDSRPLMADLNIRAIPVMIFVDSSVTTQTVVGPTSASHLRYILLNLSQNP